MGKYKFTRNQKNNYNTVMISNICTVSPKKLVALIFLFNLSLVFCQEIHIREVPFTPELYEFIDCYLNHKFTDRSLLEEAYNKAINSIPVDLEEYSKLVQKGRCLYFYGLTLMEDYDIAEMSARDLNNETEEEPKNKQAARYFDQTIELCKQALKLKKGTDAYSLLCNGISANCTAKNSAYIIRNGIKVSTYSKKSAAIDFSNGTAHYLGNCQNIYAPAPFCNLEEGVNKMKNYLDNCYINIEKFDRFYILSAIGFGYQRLGKIDEAVLWYEKSLEIYPENYSINRTLKKIRENSQNEK